MVSYEQDIYNNKKDRQITHVDCEEFNPVKANIYFVWK
jgi:hypothetical protein